MSEMAEYIRSTVDSYLSQEADVNDFRQAFAAAYCSVRNNAVGDQRAQSLATKVMTPVAEFSAGHRTEASLRAELANAFTEI